MPIRPIILPCQTNTSIVFKALSGGGRDLAGGGRGLKGPWSQDPGSARVRSCSQRRAIAPPIPKYFQRHNPLRLGKSNQHLSQMTVGRKNEVRWWSERWWSERDRERLPPRDPGHNPSSPTASPTAGTPITLSFHSCVEHLSPGSYYIVTKTLKTPSFPPVWEKNSDSSNHSWGTVLSIPRASADPSPQCPDVDTETQGSD